jgi:hydrogenase-4 component E
VSCDAAAGAPHRPGAPVRFGVALDVLVATLVLGVFFFQIREQFDSLDLHHLESLKEEA